MVDEQFPQTRTVGAAPVWSGCHSHLSPASSGRVGQIRFHGPKFRMSSAQIVLIRAMISGSAAVNRSCLLKSSMEILHVIRVDSLNHG